MLKFIVIYYIIGVIIAFINNYMFCKLQTHEQRENEMPSMILNMFIWIILWPWGITHTYFFIKRLIKNEK